MQPQDEQNQDWQAPQANSSAAPFEAPVDPDQAVQEDDQVQSQATVDSSHQEQAPADTQHVQEADYENESDESLVRWEATEHIHQERGAMWFVVLGLIVIVVMALAILLIKSITFAILIPVMAATLIMYVKRPPQTNTYSLSRKGLHVNDKLYTYDQFKSFGVVQKNGHNSVVLIPRKRFMVDQTILFPDEVGEAVVDMLAARMPMKDVEPDVIDKLLARLHL